MKLKIILIAIGISILYQGKNFILERLQSEEDWQKSQLHSGMKTVKKFKDKGVIGEEKEKQ